MRGRGLVSLERLLMALLRELKIETLTITDAARLLNVSRKTIEAYIDRGELTVILIDGAKKPIRRITLESFKKLREKILRSAS